MEENEIVKFETDEGNNFEMIILKEFSYKDKTYAVLMDKNNCNCDDDCDCGCKETDECNCDSHKCDCDDHKCDEGLYILEISTDKDGNEIFKEIEDEKLFDEVIEEADKVLYEI